MKVFICLAVVVACALAQQNLCFNPVKTYNDLKVRETIMGCKGKGVPTQATYKCIVEKFGLTNDNVDDFVDKIAKDDAKAKVKAALGECKKDTLDTMCLAKNVGGLCWRPKPEAFANER